MFTLATMEPSTLVRVAIPGDSRIRVFLPGVRHTSVPVAPSSRVPALGVVRLPPSTLYTRVLALKGGAVPIDLRVIHRLDLCDTRVADNSYIEHMCKSTPPRPARLVSWTTPAPL